LNHYHTPSDSNNHSTNTNRIHLSYCTIALHSCHTVLVHHYRTYIVYSCSNTMEGMRQSISAHNAAIAAHLQAQQHQAQAQAQQQAAVVAAAQQQHRNSSFVWQQQAAAASNATAAQMQNGYPNFMPSMLAMQSNMSQMAMVATAKLAPFTKKGASNSSLAVRNTVPRLNVAGGIYTVAQWARKCVEDNLEFVTKIARRDDPKADLVMLAYGDGCQTLVLFDSAMNKLPDDLSKIKKIHVGVSTAAIDDKRLGSEMAESGVLQPIDSLWDHLRYEQANATKDKKEKIIYIHTSMTVYGESEVGRRRVLQIKTKAPKSPFVAESYRSNVMFEREVLAKWKGESPGAAPGLRDYQMGAVGGVPILPTANDSEEKDDVNEFLITFNPKELLLLEKAFDNGLTPRDLKSKAEKWTDEDQKKCQSTILRAQNEFKYVFPRKPNRKKSKDDEEVDSGKKEKSKVAPASAKKSTPPKASKKDDTKKKPSAKIVPKKVKKATPAKKKSSGPSPKKVATKIEPVDSDDEPIVKLKTPAKKAAKPKTATPKKKSAKKDTKKVDTSKKATPAKKAASTPAKKATSTPAKKATSTPAKGKIEKKSSLSSATKKRGRDKSVGPPAKKTRSNSKPRSTRSKK